MAYEIKGSLATVKSRTLYTVLFEIYFMFDSLIENCYSDDANKQRERFNILNRICICIFFQSNVARNIRAAQIMQRRLSLLSPTPP